MQCFSSERDQLNVELQSAFEEKHNAGLALAKIDSTVNFLDYSQASHRLGLAEDRIKELKQRIAMLETESN